ncbi:PEP-CTERM system histidine kinase PrsK [Sphingosinicellaceae bacterium]|nr:PEP-CTERM system histidine kinase PrsK [Sphingosinicellaceae bacterium]
MKLTDVGLFSHLIACVGFAVLGISAVSRRRASETSLALGVAALTTATWALVYVAAARFGAGPTAWLSPLETLRSASWIVFLLSLLRVSWSLDDRLRSSFAIAGAIGFVTTVQLMLDVFGRAGEGGAPMLATLFIITRLTVAISGLVLLHNLYVNAVAGTRTGIRLLCIGLAGFFGYDLNLYTLQFLLGHLSADLYNIRGAVDAIVVPLLLMSASSSWVARVQVSRQVVFHTLSFSIIGIYLITMALTAYGLRLVGGDWGRLLQISFLFATAIGGAIVIVSQRFRARLRVVIAKNFFAYKYDYRQEWLRFISIVSRTDGQPLAQRVVEAVCVVVDAPGGALYIPGDDGGFDLVDGWNRGGFVGERLAPAPGLARYLGTQQRIVDFDEWRDGEGAYEGLAIPVWAANDRRVWLAIPLVHLDSLAGVIVLERTLAARDLNWEDFELLRTLGRQAASYIAEAQTQTALDEAGSFDEFNRRFAFIMHDIKNLVSQLSLVSRNAERHADNPAFRADMVATLQSSVGKMNDLLARLAQHNTGRPDTPEPVDAAELIGQIVSTKRRQHSPIYLVVDSGPATVAADPARLEQLFIHLIQNAIDASTADARIDIAVKAHAGHGQAGHVVVTIADHGHGMSAAFVRGELFKPFRSTKPGGFGIGAYEARSIVRSLGGSLDVLSREGEGTVFTVTVPTIAASVPGPGPTLGPGPGPNAGTCVPERNVA